VLQLKIIKITDCIQHRHRYIEIRGLWEIWV